MTVRALARFSCAVAMAALAACSISIDDQLWQCTTSADCGEGWQCDPANRFCVEAYDGQNGVFSDRLVIGTSAYLSTDIPSLAVISAQGLAGMDAYIQHVNSSGGIYGRRLELKKLDDGFDPVRAAANVEQLAGAAPDQAREVFLVCNTLGEGPSLAAADVALRERILLWTPATGLSNLEPDPPNRYVFNYRPRYSDEAEQLAQYLSQQIEPATPVDNVAVVGRAAGFQAPFDNYGQDVLTGTARGLSMPESAVFSTRYVLNSTEVVEPARRLLEWMTSPDRAVTDGRRHIAVILGATFDSAAALIKTLTDQVMAARRGEQLGAPFRVLLDPEDVDRLATVELRWAGTSPLTTDALRAALAGFGTYVWTDGAGATEQRLYGAGIVIAQVVPYALSGSSGALRYREHLTDYDASLPFGEFSLEGYLNMWLLGEALLAHGPDLTTESFIQTLENFSADLGVGPELGFSGTSHQAATRVWAIQLNAQLEPNWLGLLLDQ